MVHSHVEQELRNSFREKTYAHTYAEDFQNGAIATQLKILREDRGLTQQQLADLAGMKQSRISLMEDVNYGSWNLKTLRRLAVALDVALTVRFDSFGALIQEIASFSRQSLRRASRADDLAARAAINGLLASSSQTALAALIQERPTPGQSALLSSASTDLRQHHTTALGEPIRASIASNSAASVFTATRQTSSALGAVV